ncbi:Protein FAR1-RELATED SEQUENCE 5 [Linum perenne]
MSLKLDSEKDVYQIFHWVWKHNHVLMPPHLRQFFRSNRKISDTHKQMAIMHDSVGIRGRDSYDLMAKCSGGVEALGFTCSDLSTYIKAFRSSHIEDGGHMFLHNWFGKEATRDPGFFHVFQLDAKANIESIFWADARMQRDYEAFGDAISFDTTYRTNNTFRPLAVFTGFNHHRKLVVFGACLIFEETTEGFKWLFENFLECMKKKHPTTIFTDQCPAIAAGIRAVFPNTFHGLCTFHILENAKDKIKKGMKEGMMSSLCNLMFDVDDEAGFNKCWESTISKHFPGKGPYGHPWLAFMYKFRHQWSSAWVNNNFTCGMQSSQLSESFNSNLKIFLNTKCNLHQFFTQFNRLLESKRADELQLDFNALNSVSPARYTVHPHVHQAFKVCLFEELLHVCIILFYQYYYSLSNCYYISFQFYTKTIFMHFELEYSAMSAYFPKSFPINIGENIKAYDWFKLDEDQKTVIDKRRVIVNSSSSDYKCTCRVFDSCGWLCRHILKTMDFEMQWNHFGPRTIPRKYFKDRWSKTAKLGLSSIVLDNSTAKEPDSEADRYQSLCSLIAAFALEASPLVSTYKVAREIITAGRNRVRTMILEQHDLPTYGANTTGQGISNLLHLPIFNSNHI